MNFSKILFWGFVIMLLSVDFSSEVGRAKVYWWTSKYWYSLAAFAGSVGMKAEKKYHDEMEFING